MRAEHWWVTAPWLTEVALVACCLWVWARLRQLGRHGVGQWTLAAIVVDAGVQSWGLGARLGRPAGVGWLVHAMLCYLMVYVVLRLGELLSGRQGHERGAGAQCWASLAKSEEEQDG